MEKRSTLVEALRNIHSKRVIGLAEERKIKNYKNKKKNHAIGEINKNKMANLLYKNLQDFRILNLLVKHLAK